MFADVVSTPQDIRVTFRFERPQPVVLELRVNVIAKGAHDSLGLREVRKMIEGARYSRGLCGSCLECDWYQVATLIRRCLDRVRSVSGDTVISLSPQNETGVINSFQVEGSADMAIHRLEDMVRAMGTGHAGMSPRPVMTPNLQDEQPAASSIQEGSRSLSEPSRRGMILGGAKKKNLPLSRAAV